MLVLQWACASGPCVSSFRRTVELISCLLFQNHEKELKENRTHFGWCLYDGWAMNLSGHRDFGNSVMQN